MTFLTTFLLCILYVMIGIALAANVIKDEEDAIIDTDENVGCGIVMLALVLGILWAPISVIYGTYWLVRLLCNKLKKN